MTDFPSTPALLLRGAGQLGAALAATPGLMTLDARPGSGVVVPDGFLGVNVAAANDPAVDDYIIQRLTETGLQHVRMDYSYDSAEGPAGRLLGRLLEAGFSVFLKLIPPIDDARALASDTAAKARWQHFLENCFETLGDSVTCFEIGATPNRGRWSGFSAQSYLAAWHSALRALGDRDLKLAGPNVSDFEPLYNLGFLGMMRQFGAGPAIHTDNLFVERVVEPEALDHRVLGRAFTRLSKLNLIKKSRVLQAIGRRHGANTFYCTYTCWTSKRLGRRNAWPERKAANYMLRYLLLAAASDSLGRVYWGPLICSRDGLIHDEGGDYPDIDQVSFYEAVRGDINSFTPTPALATLALAAELLEGSRIVDFRHDDRGLSACRLAAANGNYHYVLWCRDGMNWPLADLLEESDDTQLTVRDVFGKPLDTVFDIGESPIIISTARGDLLRGEPLPDYRELGRLTQLDLPTLTSTAVRDPDWPGAILLRRSALRADRDLARSLHPSRIREYPELAVLRDARNRIWNIEDPRDADRQLSVKLNRVQGIKRFTYRFRPSKGARHWNNACHMLRHGIATPTPVAFFERPENSGVEDSWYICEFIPGAFSSREVYAAFREGESSYQGLDKAAWFDLLAGFVGKMHNLQIVHRDLSAGNLLLHEKENGEMEAMLIDIGRASIWTGPGSRVKARHRLIDLIRICYKLNWQDREDFVARYETLSGARLGRWWRLPFHYYDNKQRFKKSLKGKRKKKRR